MAAARPLSNRSQCDQGRFGESQIDKGGEVPASNGRSAVCGLIESPAPTEGRPRQIVIRKRNKNQGRARAREEAPGPPLSTTYRWNMLGVGESTFCANIP